MKEILKAHLVKEEGLRLKLYKCPAGKTSIGVGRNLEDCGISYDEAMQLLESDCERVMNEAKTFTWFESLSEVRQVVVCDMIFNMGLHRFKGFTKTIAALESGEYAEAAKEMILSAWAEQVGERSHALANMIKSGDL